MPYHHPNTQIEYPAIAIPTAGTAMMLPKMAIPGAGCSAHIKDPDGNIAGLHQQDANAK